MSSSHFPRRLFSRLTGAYVTLCVFFVAVVAISSVLFAGGGAALRILAVTMSACGFGFVCFKWWATKRFVNPLTRLHLGARHLSKGNFTGASQTLQPRDAVEESPEVEEIMDCVAEVQRRFSQELATLKTEQQELSTILSNLHEGVISIDTHQRLTFINDAALRSLGATGTAVKHLWELTREIQVIEAFLNCLKTSQPVEASLKLVVRNQEVQCRMRVQPFINEQGQTYGAVGILQRAS